MSTSETARGPSTKLPRPLSDTGRRYVDLMTLASVAKKNLVAAAALSCLVSTAFAQTLPTDPQPIAVVPPATFATWFASGHPATEGMVTPANSVTFTNGTVQGNVDFYQWSERMFLWLTSPAPNEYGGGGGRIFASPTFYDVSAADVNGVRTLIPHQPGKPSIFMLRAAQPGPHGLPVIVSTSGVLFEVVPSVRGPQQEHLILNGEGKSVPFKELKVEGKRATFLNSEGLAIPNAKPVIPPQLKNSRVVQRFTIGNKTVFLDPSGNEVEVGEAETGGVLLRQDSTLIYYGIAVNDVYAYFLTQTKGSGVTTPVQFPTTQTDLDKIVSFAQAHSKTFPDPNALAIEVKTAWVEAVGLPNANTYITMTATVPKYDSSNPMQWVQKGTKTVELALVGMHVVGSTNGHPEMIWASFEHFGNSPNSAYTYNSINGANPTTVPQNTVETWLFCQNGAAGGFNTARQGIQTFQNILDGEIVAFAPATTIGPSNTIRFMPFGAAVNQTPNPLVTSVAESNTQILSMNHSVISQLVGADVRKNYFLLGATWTELGAAPTSPFQTPTPPGSPAPNEVGTSQLANSTMETFQMPTNNGNFGRAFNCFACHNNQDASHPTNSPNATTNLSHIFDAIQKLF
jgi:hypothetical protein